MSKSVSRIAFIASDSDFLLRHFGPAIEAAKDLDADILALVPVATENSTRVADNIQIISHRSSGNRNSVRELSSEWRWLSKILRNEPPSIIVGYSLRICVLSVLLQPLLRRTQFVCVVTSLGFFVVSNSIFARAARLAIFSVLRLASPTRTSFIFENNSDRARIGLSERLAARSSIHYGAGVDPDEYSPSNIPNTLPIRFATVSRLIWSKGVDIAATAISRLADKGEPVELHIFGYPDFSNPQPVDPKGFEGLNGVYFHGRSERISEIWQDHHVAIFASRGGEGLPRALLEAAACGRPCVVTNVPGCADFIRDGVEGYVASPDSEDALEEAILRCVREPGRLPALGANARSRLLAMSTAEDTKMKYHNLFAALQKLSAPRERAC
ncbi:MAG: glycosyltransferase [Xanthobacteraceae bacterium]|nr:glycosyltransferase [Xanthobacteraceae bacterium]